MNSSDSDSKWALYNPLKSWTLFNLNRNDLRLVIRSLNDTEVRLTKISEKGSTSWKALDRQLHADFFPIKDTPDSLNDNTGYPEIVHNADAVTDTGYFIIKPNRILHPRLHQRYDVSVPCVLIGNTKQFHTESVDLSEGGLHFKDSIPPWIAGYFLVIVKSNYQLMCSLVEDQKEKKRVQIVSEESDFHYIQYKNWLTTF